jgi:hypothetical protein
VNSADTFGTKPPFSICLLGGLDEDAHHIKDDDDDDFLSLFAASYRNASDNLVPPVPDENVNTYVKKELDLKRLNDVIGWLWIAGRPMPPRPLHTQIFVRREIVITERLDMHLVWTSGRIFLKPIPRFLLKPGFWSECLLCQEDCQCTQTESDTVRDIQYCDRQKLRRCALGFLFSYVALITHESDFRIAKENHLLPIDIQWQAWRIFVQQLDPEHIYPRINTRFVYGELRLSRLNKIYHLSQRSFWRGYSPRWDRYGAFLADNFTLLTSLIIYIAVVLTAMQVGLATQSLAENQTFQHAAHGFTVFSILGPLIIAVLILFAFCVAFVYNNTVTIKYRNKRFYDMGITVKSDNS